MIGVRHGYSRIVLLIGFLAIKVPNIFNGDRAFVIGMEGNLHEHEVYKTAHDDPRLAKVYFRFPFALALVVRRYRKIVQQGLTLEEIKSLPLSGLDPKIGNYARDNSGRLVVLDYGNSDVWYTGGTE